VPELSFETSSVGVNLGFDPDEEVYITDSFCRWVSVVAMSFLKIHM
jgi:hypothetical protein